MKKIILSLLAVSVVVPFLALAADEETPAQRASRMSNGNPMDVVQSWGQSGRNTPIHDCQLFVNGPVTQCFDLSKPKPATPLTPQETLLNLQQQLVDLLTQLKEALISSLIARIIAPLAQLTK